MYKAEQSLMAHGDDPMGSEHVSETAKTNIRGNLCDCCQSHSCCQTCLPLKAMPGFFSKLLRKFSIKFPANSSTKLSAKSCSKFADNFSTKVPSNFAKPNREPAAR